MSHVVERFGTGYVHTTVMQVSDGYRWLRAAGPDRPVPIGRLTAAVRLALAGLPGLVLPEQGATAAGLTFRASAPDSLAALFLGAGHGDPQTTAAARLSAVAATLAALHRVPAPAGLSGPVGGQRLSGWLETGTGPRAAARLRERARTLLGSRRIQVLRHWCAQLTGTGATLLHGAPGTGVIVGSALLTGEEVAAGRGEWDLGWLIGELVEFRDVPRHVGHDGLRPLDYGALIGAVLRGYDGGYDPAAVGHAAVLRFLTHAHDYAAFMGWQDFLDGYLTAIAEAVDAAEQGSLVHLPVQVTA